ncbi:MAG: HAD-IA family hydrolase, partial [Verrucomicrobiae bacterium]|nr:HAD-IA family hydrolase [Verrucomicrobiae bacterium]
KLGVQPVECVVIEDAVNGVQAAKAAGMRCIAVAQSFPAKQLNQADRVLPGIGDIQIDDLAPSPAP